MNGNAITEQILVDTYLDCVDKYLTIKHMATCYGLSHTAMIDLVNKGKFIHEQNLIRSDRLKHEIYAAECKNSS